MIMGIVNMDQIKSLMVDKPTQRSEISEVVTQTKSSTTLPQGPEPESVCPLKGFSRYPFGDAVSSFKRRASISQSHFVPSFLQSLTQDGCRLSRPGPFPVTKEMKYFHTLFHI
jgi:hypothetical protein